MIFLVLLRVTGVLETWICGFNPVLYIFCPSLKVREKPLIVDTSWSRSVPLLTTLWHTGNYLYLLLRAFRSVTHIPSGPLHSQVNNYKFRVKFFSEFFVFNGSWKWEQRWVGMHWQMFGTLSRTEAIDVYFLLNMQFLCKNSISVSACYSTINRRLLLQ